MINYEKLGYLLLIIPFNHYIKRKMVKEGKALLYNLFKIYRKRSPQILMFHLTFFGQQYMSVRTK